MPLPCSKIQAHTRGGLAADGVVYLDELRLAGGDLHLGQDRRQTRAECLKLLLRIPDLADLVLVARAETDLIVETLRRKDAVRVKATNNLVVLAAVNDGGANRISTLTSPSTTWGREPPRTLRLDASLRVEAAARRSSPISLLGSVVERRTRHASHARDRDDIRALKRHSHWIRAPRGQGRIAIGHFRGLSLEASRFASARWLPVDTSPSSAQ